MLGFILFPFAFIFFVIVLAFELFVVILELMVACVMLIFGIIGFLIELPFALYTKRRRVRIRYEKN
jgi:hypothetical protein